MHAVAGAIVTRCIRALDALPQSKACNPHHIILARMSGVPRCSATCTQQINTWTWQRLP